VHTTQATVRHHLQIPLNWEKLSPLAIASIRQIATPLSFGYSLIEIASAIGIAPSFAQSLLDELKNELAQLAGAPPDDA
jgi:hypothetical protein